MRIRFLSTQIFETLGPGKGPRFEDGSTLDETEVGAKLGIEPAPGYPQNFLQRWIDRGVAVEVVDEPAAVPPEDEPEPAVVQQPLGMAKRGRPTKGLDDK